MVVGQALKHLQVRNMLLLIKHYDMETTIPSYFSLWAKESLLENTGTLYSVGTLCKDKWTQKKAPYILRISL